MYKCVECGKLFASIMSLTGHKRMHGPSDGISKKILCSCLITKKVIAYQYLENCLLDVYMQKKSKDLWKARKSLAQNRIINNFSLDTMINHFYSVWKNEVVNERFL